MNTTHEDDSGVTAMLQAAALLDEPRFAVLNAARDSDGRVSGLLRYTLSDGRTVGVADKVPADVITPDGKYVDTGAGEPTVEIQPSAAQP